MVSKHRAVIGSVFSVEFRKVALRSRYFWAMYSAASDVRTGLNLVFAKKRYFLRKSTDKVFFALLPFAP